MERPAGKRKALALEVGFPEDVTSYSLRSGFVRAMFSLGLPTDLIKKFLHHAPTSVDARRHYEGDLTNFDVAALRANVPPAPTETLDLLEQLYVFTEAKPLRLSKLEIEKVKDELFTTDANARKAKEEYDKLTIRIKKLRKGKGKGDAKLLPNLINERKRVWDGYGQKLARRKRKRLNEIKREKMAKTRSTMTMDELTRRRESCQGPVFTNRLDFIRYVQIEILTFSFIFHCLSEIDVIPALPNSRRNS